MEVVSIVNEIFRLYEDAGQSQYLGENVTKTQHSIQCAMCAEKDGAVREEIVAAFLHDVGHLLGIDENLPEMVTDGENVGTKDHDVVGGKYLIDKGFPKLVCDIVAGHVQAKRYLVYKYKDYYEKLSDASKKTLVHQGGPMTKEEAIMFEQSEAFQPILRMRKYDELAKDPTAKMEPLKKYREMCIELLLQNKV
ncbi:2-amino-1-hydroxyethylphosphonate dioxygenase (glycine-forming)-like [Ruditapes philippinarum]|nr:2-amino-1-hydroxyethylphosphonate dioxygenase (glycine-forming)-like isoform X2 [Ruditapes philippinarum]XP_060568075.1 2-amino-1-hydroxyethylphosphonate dioxygenase (glycine-forming)-like isoform X2 [Ruditapes philippinarum]XP_060570335.1 2-amino-1-hydroxyethylphosphonate dioxygenase (glycine-forming)-like [Ruditapes philippinarum]